MISDPTITVTCDGCRYEEVFDLTGTALGWDDRNLYSDMKRSGWVNVDDKDLCEDCAREHGEPTNDN